MGKTRPIEARLNEVQLKMTRLETLQRKQANGERFVIGELIIEAARRDPAIRDMLLAEVGQHTMREMDRRRIETLVEELRKLAT